MPCDLGYNFVLYYLLTIEDLFSAIIGITDRDI